MNRNRLVGYSLAGGMLITLITGLYPLRTLLGGTHYGFPMAWLVRRGVGPEFFPWRVTWLGLLVDLVVWTVVVIVILVLYDQYRSRSTGRQPT